METTANSLVEYGSRRIIITVTAVVCAALDLRLAQLITRFQSQGYDVQRARLAAYSLLEETVQRQSTLLSYMDVFLWVGTLFLACVPLVLIFVKRSERKSGAADMAAH